jgi:PTH1 family peptidyl-tRNA hydrolase
MVIVGLGNPGRSYDGTRHNVGFDLVERLIERWHASPVISVSPRLFHAWRAEVDGQDVYLVTPVTYMNRSGIALRLFLEAYDLEARDCLVIVDDMALETGRLRFRRRGSAGGHNGLISIEERLGTRDYARLRVGIGPAPASTEWADFVLTPFSKEERERIEEALDRAVDGIELLLEEGMDRTMSLYNR